MPYANNTQLPRGIQSMLSPAAQDVYRDAYNYAWDTFRYAQDRYDRDESRQVTANRAAWEAVKRLCRRDQRGKWIPREDGETVEQLGQLIQRRESQTPLQRGRG